LKTLKEFLESQKIDTKDVLESEDFPKVLGENTQPDPMDPPAVLIMRRKSIRQFSNGQRVALYYVDKINKYVTVPYMASLWSSAMPEEWEKTNKD
jgi:hypothetical protein